MFYSKSSLKPQDGAEMNTQRQADGHVQGSSTVDGIYSSSDSTSWSSVVGSGTSPVVGGVNRTSPEWLSYRGQGVLGSLERNRPEPEGFARMSLATTMTARTPSRISLVACLLYTSDAADDMQCVDLGCRRIIKKKKKKNEFFFFKQKTAYFFFSSRRRHTR